MTRRDPMICGHCHKRGHLIANCFKLKRDNRVKSTPNTDSELGLCVSSDVSERRECEWCLCSVCVNGLHCLTRRPRGARACEHT